MQQILTAENAEGAEESRSVEQCERDWFDVFHSKEVSASFACSAVKERGVRGLSGGQDSRPLQTWVLCLESCVLGLESWVLSLVFCFSESKSVLQVAIKTIEYRL